MIALNVVLAVALVVAVDGVRILRRHQRGVQFCPCRVGDGPRAPGTRMLVASGPRANADATAAS